MQNHSAWIQKAKNDLKGAKVLFREHINDLAIYHAHQCVEKVLKAYLAFKQCSIQKTHDLVVLTETCNRYDPSFEKIRDEVSQLNPFGTIMRYPGVGDDPDQKITGNSITIAENIFLFVQKKI
ncbi:MAG: HEPN domain-containing protein [Chlamydiales bacterium]|nr:HEPN domain-containing protein [Chlamydiales bacterium]